MTAGGDLVMNGTASGIGTAIRTAGAVALEANSITQATFTTIAAGQLDVATTAGASLLGGGNVVDAFGASNTVSGAIALLNTAPTLTLNGFTQVPGGAINVTQTGDLVLPTMSFGAGTISASGTASIPSGVTFTAAGGTLSAPTLDVQSGARKLGVLGELGLDDLAIPDEHDLDVVVEVPKGSDRPGDLALRGPIGPHCVQDDTHRDLPTQSTSTSKTCSSR